MPPRAKRGGAAKKPSPRAKAASRTSKKQVVPLNVVEEDKILESEVPVTPVEDKSVAPSIAAEETDGNQIEEVSVEKDSVAEDVPPSIDEMMVVVKEEVLVSTVVVVEETKVIEEIVEEKNSETVVVEETTKVVEEIENSETVVVEEAAEEIGEEKNLETENVEEAKVVKEIVDEKNEEIGTSEVALDVQMEEKEPSQEDPEEEEDDPEEEVIGGGENENKDDRMNEEQVAKQDRDEETAAQNIIEGKDGDDTTDANEGVDMEEKGGSGSDDEENEDEDASAYMPAPLTDRKKQKEFEIFVGGLDRGAVEEDLTKVFAEFGEIQSVRIIKHPVTQKSKGFAFVRYATVEQAKKAIAELKDGTEVRGKHVGVSQSEDCDTLSVGNICKTWKKDQVLETLKSLGIEQIEEIYLPEDPKSEGNIGSALLEFSSHSDAMAAFQRLKKPDAVFGCDISAKVAFAQSSIHPSEEVLSQVTTVYVEGLTESWNEEKLQGFCEQYGKIEKVQLSRDLITSKRKDFGFVSFTSRESAVACVEGINNAQIAEGDVKVKANLAKPQYKGRLGKPVARGGYKVKVDGTEEPGPSKMRGRAKLKGSKGKEKFLPKLRSTRGAKPFKPQFRGGERHSTGAPFGQERTDSHRKEQCGRGGGRRGGNGRSMEAGFHGRPSTQPCGNAHGRASNGVAYPRNNSHYAVNGRQHYGGAPPMYVDPYAQGYAAPASSYPVHAYGAHSGSKRHYSDMAPHAGYIEPSAAKQARDRYGYDRRRAGGYDGEGSGVHPAYGGGSVPSSSNAPPVHSHFAGYQAVGSSYFYPSTRASYPPRPGYY